MITPSDKESFLAAAAEFARKANCSNITEAEDAITEIVRSAATIMMQTMADQLSGASEYDGAYIDCVCGEQARYREMRGKDLLTVHKVVRVKRGYYRCDHCKSTYSPWDSRQGLSRRMWTPRVKELVSALCAALPYKPASALLSEDVGFEH